MKNKSSAFLFSISILIEIIGILGNSLNIMFWGIMLLWLSIIIYSSSNLKRRMILLMFSITFFNFMIGKLLIHLIMENEILSNFSFNTAFTTLLLVFLSLISVLIGNFIYENVSIKKREERKEVYKNAEKKEIIRRLSRIMFIISLSIALIISLEQALFVLNNGYLALYTSFSSRLPSILNKIGNASLLLFFIYLYTFPSKRETYISMAAYIVYTLINLLTGDRSAFVIIILLLIIYLYYRQKELGEQFFTKKFKIASFFMAIIIIAFLGNYNYSRNNIESRKNGLIQNFILFFDDQGGSINIIPYTIINENRLRQLNSHYATGPIINYFRYGSIGSLIQGKKQLKNNTVEMAKEGNNLGASLTYITRQNYYLSGGGLGTEYIAELYIEFGYVGVILYNLFIGYILGFIFNINKNRIFTLAMTTVVVRYLLFIPRDFAFSWIVNLFSISNIFAILLLNITANTLKKKGYEYG